MYLHNYLLIIIFFIFNICNNLNYYFLIQNDFNILNNNYKNNIIDNQFKIYIKNYKKKTDDTLNKWIFRTKEIYYNNRKQNISYVNKLNKKWNNVTLIGENISSWKLFKMQKNVIDLSDNNLLTSSQYYHSLQTFKNMLDDNINSPKLLFLALYHDIGKILVLFGEEQYNVMCSTFILYEKKNEYCTNHFITTWGHDEFAYIKLKRYLNPELLWIIRYHSLLEFIHDNFTCLLTDNEKKYLKTLKLFYKYDKQKDIYKILNNEHNLTNVKNIIHKFLPKKIVF